MARSNFILASLMALAVACAATSLRGLRSPGASAQSTPVGNGDVNDDRSIDVSDPIYLLTYLFAAGAPPEPIQTQPCNESVALVVRHAEKELAGADPCLTPEGLVRAEHLRDTLSRTKVDGIFATNYCRTAQTVEPLALERGLAVQRLNTAEAIAAAVKALPPGSKAVVAGNSFNVPDIVKALGASEPVTVPGDEFDNLWVIHFSSTGTGPASLTHLRY
jgi:hypothetical protein